MPLPMAAAAPTAQAAAPLPAWWNLFPDLPRLESAFVQESESAVFGKLQRRGRLFLARGGKLRVEYDQGLLLVADGRRLVQYDPDARTAQAFELARAAAEMPLVNLLVDPRALARTYEAAPERGAVRLAPRRPGLPEVRVEGRGNLPSLIEWTDATGSRQRLLLLDAHVPARLSPGAFSFALPKGGRWMGRP